MDSFRRLSATAAGGHMNRTRRIGRLGGLIAVVGAVVLAPFLWLWAVAGWLLWRAWWRHAGVRLSALDDPGRLLAAAVATLPADRRDWGAAMAAELAQVPVQARAARWRFAAGCARTAIFPPGGSPVAVGVAGVAVAATAAAALATTTLLPAGRVFAPAFVGLVGGMATLAVARSHRAGWAWPGAAITGLGLAGVAACIAATGYYLAEFPAYHRADPPATLPSLPPVTAAVLAVLLAGCLWLAVRPPRWLLPDRHARRFGVGMAVALVAGFVLTTSRQELGDPPGSEGMVFYLLIVPILVVLTGSAAAAAVGRSFRSGLRACAWAVVLGAPRADHRLAGRGAALVSDGSGDGPGWGRGAWGRRQPEGCGLVAPGVPGAVGNAPGGGWRGRRERAGPRARRSRLDDLVSQFEPDAG
jgi:hypothetical protein